MRVPAVQLHSHLSLEIGKSEWPTSHPGQFLPTKGAQWIGVLVGLEISLDIWRREFFSTGRESSYSVVQLLVLTFKTGLHGTRAEYIRESQQSYKYWTLFSCVDSNNVLHVLCPLVLILRMRWAGKVACKGEHTYLHTYTILMRTSEGQSLLRKPNEE